MTYDLTKVSERFRALEDGHSILRNGNWCYRPKDLQDNYHLAERIVQPGTWTLIPKPAERPQLWWFGSEENGWYLSPHANTEDNVKNSYGMDERVNYRPSGIYAPEEV